MICRYKIKFISDIEQKIRKLLVNIAVAPFVGVWIEINVTPDPPKPNKSLPLWECGLKSLYTKPSPIAFMSLPLWECGLKSSCTTVLFIFKMSLPLWECGLKFI